MASYTQMLFHDGAVRVDMVMRDDGVPVLTGQMHGLGGELVDVEVQGDAAPTAAFRAWLAAGGVVGAPVPPPRACYGDDLIVALTDAELTAMAGGTMRDQRMLSAQRVPFRATDDVVVRLAAVMKIDPAAWLARAPVAG